LPFEAFIAVRYPAVVPTTSSLPVSEIEGAPVTEPFSTVVHLIAPEVGSNIVTSPVFPV
jgi:hypothetical protein